MSECRYKRFSMIYELVDYINVRKITQDRIVNIIYDTNYHEYILIYFTLAY
jgi:hypothetical protein